MTVRDKIVTLGDVRIGIPKERKSGERRVALTPAVCAILLRQGHEVILERAAGVQAGFSDAEYRKVGVAIATSPAALYRQAALIVKVKEPQPGEWRYLKPHHQLFCFLHLAANARLHRALSRIGVSAFAFEDVREGGKAPILAPMSAIAGRVAVAIGAYHLQASQGGRGVLLGADESREHGRVIVIGAGVAGSEAARLASAMGASVLVFDRDPARLAALHAAYPSIATALTSPDALNLVLSDADLVIGAAYVPGARAPLVLDERAVRHLPPGAVVVDIAIDQGGSIATSRLTSHARPVVRRLGVLHCGIPNLPAAVPRTASIRLAEALLPYLSALAAGGLTLPLQGARVRPL